MAEHVRSFAKGPLLRALRVLCFALTCASIPATSAAAGTAAASTPAQRLYKAGARAFRNGDWQQARRSFIDAYALNHEAGLLYDIALATWRMAQSDPHSPWLREARDYFRRYLDEAPNGRSREPARRALAEIEKSLQPAEAATAPTQESPAQAQEPVATAETAQTTTEPEAKPTSAETARPEPTPTNEAAQTTTAPEIKTPVPPEPLMIPEELEPAARVQLTAPPLHVPPAPRRQPLYRRWWLWTSVGVVAAGVAVGLGVGLTSHPFSPTLSDFGPGTASPTMTAR
jgi:hypothetical protein